MSGLWQCSDESSFCVCVHQVRLECFYLILSYFVEKGSVADLWNTKVKLTKENPRILMTLHLNGSVADLWNTEVNWRNDTLVYILTHHLILFCFKAYLEDLRKRFPNSLDNDILLSNCSWEYAVLWNKDAEVRECFFFFPCVFGRGINKGNCLPNTLPLLGVNLSPEFVNLYFPYAGRGLLFFSLVASAFWVPTGMWGSRRKKQYCAKYTCVTSNLTSTRFLGLFH